MEISNPSYVEERLKQLLQNYEKGDINVIASMKDLLNSVDRSLFWILTRQEQTLNSFFLKHIKKHLDIFEDERSLRQNYALFKFYIELTLSDTWYDQIDEAISFVRRLRESQNFQEKEDF